MNLDHLRRTGRTTRMLKDALDSIRGGGYAFIVVDSKNDADRIRGELLKMADGTVAGTKFYPSTGGSLSVEFADQEQWSWNTLSFRGAHPSCKVFIDHFVIERRFGELFRRMHQYDEPT